MENIIFSGKKYGMKINLRGFRGNAITGIVSTPYVGITRIRFEGYDLRS